VNTADPPSVPVCAITAERLRLVSPGLSGPGAEVHALALEAARPAGELSTPARVRHFIAQCAHDTEGFLRLSDKLVPVSPWTLEARFPAVKGRHHARALLQAGEAAIANLVYAGKGGNGPVMSGDGWTYRPRGYLRAFGRAGYRAFGAVTGLPLEEAPDWLGDPSAAAIAAAAYWLAMGVNAYADADDAPGVCRQLKAVPATGDDRRAWLGLARAAWP
jgi:putative chitinase